MFPWDFTSKSQSDHHKKSPKNAPIRNSGNAELQRACGKGQAGAARPTDDHPSHPEPWSTDRRSGLKQPSNHPHSWWLLIWVSSLSSGSGKSHNHHGRGRKTKPKGKGLRGYNLCPPFIVYFRIWGKEGRPSKYHLQEFCLPFFFPSNQSVMFLNNHFFPLYFHAAWDDTLSATKQQH